MRRPSLTVPARIALVATLMALLAPMTFGQSTWYVNGAAAPGGNGTQAAPHQTILAAVTAAANGDLILVAPGTYIESLNPTGKAITVRADQGPAVTTLQPPSGFPCAAFVNGEDNATVLDGFTLTGASTPSGAGLDCSDGEPRILNCIIRDNVAYASGAGIYIGSNRAPVLINCAIINNTSTLQAAGIYASVDSSPLFLNCTIAANTVLSGSGGAMTLSFNANPQFTNSIIYGNAPNEISQDVSSIPVFHHCNVLGGAPGIAVLNLDPVFVDIGSGNFRLCATSPCIDTGDSGQSGLPLFDIDGDPRITGPSIDMGADEYRPPPSTSIWYVDSTVIGPGCGTVPSPFQTIQDAIVAAGTGDSIIVAPGLYNETLDFLGKAISLSSSGGPTVTTVDAGYAGTVVQFVNGESSTSVLDGFTLRSGLVNATGGGVLCSASSPTISNCRIMYCNATVSGGGVAAVFAAAPALNAVSVLNNNAATGAGVFCDGTSSISLSGCTVSTNVATGDGGGIAINAPAGSTTILDCIITSNTSGAAGGGVRLMPGTSGTITGGQISQNSAGQTGGGCHVTGSDFAIANCALDANHAGISGGGINAGTGTTLQVANCTISNSTAVVRGGGAFVEEPVSASLTSIVFDGNTVSFGRGGGLNCQGSVAPTISGCQFIGNSCVGSFAADGGGISCETTVIPPINDCEFRNNTANGDGGGFWSEQATSLEVNGCRFEGNTATRGGGVLIKDALDAVLARCEILSNSGHQGGGIALDSSTVSLLGCTIATNSSTLEGGGAYAQSSQVTANGCTFTLNGSSAGGSLYVDASSTASLSNDILWAEMPSPLAGSGSTAVDHSDVEGGFAGTGNISAPPLFRDVTTWDFHLLPMSPCRDTGTTASVLPGTDLDGDPRPSGSGPDMGSDEIVYIHTSQPNGPNSFLLEINGPPSHTYFCCFTMDMMNAGAGLGTGWFAGLHIPFPEVIGQFLIGHAPFIGPLSSTGHASYSLDPLPPGLLPGQTWYCVAVFLTPGTMYAVGNSDVAWFTFP